MTDRPSDIPIGELRENLSEVTDQVSRGRRIIVTRNGKARMALVPIEDLDRLREIEDAEDVAVYHSRKHEKSIPWAQVKAQLGL